MVVTKNSTQAKPEAKKGKTTIPKPKRAVASGGGGAKGDTVEIVRSYLYEMHRHDIDKVAESEVLQTTGYARTDSTGYRKAMTKLTKELHHVNRAGGKLGLTEEGHRYIQENGLSVKVAPATNKEHQEQLKETILKNPKAPAKALNAIWEVMIDGKWHTREELLEAAGYKRPDSTGYREVMKWLGKLELLEKDGTATYKFTDKVYRHGSRPN